MKTFTVFSQEPVILTYRVQMIGVQAFSLQLPLELGLFFSEITRSQK
jgi:hypothetical protein